MAGTMTAHRRRASGGERSERRAQGRAKTREPHENPLAAQKRLAKVEAEIDEQAAAVWGINPAELRGFQSSLADLR